MRRVVFGTSVAVWLMLSIGPLVSLAQASKIEPGKKVTAVGGLSTSAPTLAFTGINVWVVLLIGAALLAIGVALRRWTTRAIRA